MGGGRCKSFRLKSSSLMEGDSDWLYKTYHTKLIYVQYICSRLNHDAHANFMHLFNYFLLKYHYSSKNQCVRDWDFVFLYMWIVQHPDNFYVILKETSLLSLSIRPFMLTLRATEQCTILPVSADTATLHLGFTILSKWLTVEIQTWKQSSDFSNTVTLLLLKQT